MTMLREVPLSAPALAEAMMKRIAKELSGSCRVPAGSAVLLGFSGGPCSRLLLEVWSRRVATANQRVVGACGSSHSLPPGASVPSPADRPLPDLRELAGRVGMADKASPNWAAVCFVDPRSLASLIERSVVDRLSTLTAAAFSNTCEHAATSLEGCPLAALTIPLECAFVDDLTPWVSMSASPPDLTEARASLLRLFEEGLVTAEARDEGVWALTQRVLRRTARVLGCDTVCLASSADRAAEQVIGGVSCGRGMSQPADAAFRDERFCGGDEADVAIIRPFVTSLKREALMFCRSGGSLARNALLHEAKAGTSVAVPALETVEIPLFSSASPTVVASAVAAARTGGVASLARRLIAELSHRFPTTPLTVVRTMQNCKRGVLSQATLVGTRVASCPLCGSLLEAEDLGTELHLCFGCRRMIADGELLGADFPRAELFPSDVTRPLEPHEESE
jgi:hypothetical protein